MRWAVQEMDQHFARGAQIFEMVPGDTADADTLLARQRTPGHVLEACWFLLDAADTIPAGLRQGSSLF